VPSCFDFSVPIESSNSGVHSNHSLAIPGPSTSPHPPTPTPTFVDPPIPSASGFTVDQMSAWNLLALNYSHEQLRCHKWEWVEKSNSFLPRYTFQRMLKITDIWTKYTSGLNGFLSVQDLDEGWAARWRTGMKR
jgi:hypothetical protein